MCLDEEAPRLVWLAEDLSYWKSEGSLTLEVIEFTCFESIQNMPEPQLCYESK